MTLQEMVANQNAQAFECQRLQQLRMIEDTRRQGAWQAQRARNNVIDALRGTQAAAAAPIRPRKTVESRVVEPRMLNA